MYSQFSHCMCFSTVVSGHSFKHFVLCYCPPQATLFRMHIALDESQDTVVRIKIACIIPVVKLGSFVGFTLWQWRWKKEEEKAFFFCQIGTKSIFNYYGSEWCIFHQLCSYCQTWYFLLLFHVVLQSVHCAFMYNLPHMRMHLSIFPLLYRWAWGQAIKLYLGVRSSLFITEAEQIKTSCKAI